MYKRLIILSVIILMALCGLIWLGYNSIKIRAEGLKGTRLGEFASVAEQIRRDVKNKLDDFMQRERSRPYTDYLYYYVPENIISNQQQLAFLRSPLAGRLEHGLAYGNFQIESDGSITTPNDDLDQVGLETDSEFTARVVSNQLNIKNNLLPLLSDMIKGTNNKNIYNNISTPQDSLSKAKDQTELTGNEELKEQSKQNEIPQVKSNKALPIESLQQQPRKTQITPERRSIIEQNTFYNTASRARRAAGRGYRGSSQISEQDESPQQQIGQQSFRQPQSQQVQPQSEQLQPQSQQERQNDMVQVRIGPFETIVTDGENVEESIFGGQVFWGQARFGGRPL